MRSTVHGPLGGRFPQLKPPPQREHEMKQFEGKVRGRQGCARVAITSPDKAKLDEAEAFVGENVVTVVVDLAKVTQIDRLFDLLSSRQRWHRPVRAMRKVPISPSGKQYPFSMTTLTRPDMEKQVVDAWSALENHFQHHAELVSRFRRASRRSVVHMWRGQTNEDGSPFSQF